MIGRHAGAAVALLACALAPASAPLAASSGHPIGDEAPVGIAPRYLLMDAQGRAVTQEDFRGRFQLVTFGFVSCPDVCPTTLLEYKHVLVILGNEAARIQAIFITVDPERDSRQILREYTGAFDPRILALTGSPELVRRAADTFRVQYEKVREPGAPPDQYTMSHTAGMFLLDPQGRFLAKFPYAMPAREIAERIRQTLMADSSR